jgi:hypothetical protein
LPISLIVFSEVGIGFLNGKRLSFGSASDLLGRNGFSFNAFLSFLNGAVLCIKAVTISRFELPLDAINE